MQTFTCQCGNRVYYNDLQCTQCGRVLGFDAVQLRARALDAPGHGGWVDAGSGEPRTLCANFSSAARCNWLLDGPRADGLCRACRLTDIIPDLSHPAHQAYWGRLEAAKRHLLYSLRALALPIPDREDDPDRGLVFEFLADRAADSEFTEPLPNEPAHPTGHDDGRITINLAEADPVALARQRESLDEPYRTLLGHFRHEVGHFYFLLLVTGSQWEAPCRELFGDERADYQSALERHYAEGPPPDWHQRHLSAYAAAHPSEDWAETFAHYLHMTDTLDTARDCHLEVRGRRIGAAGLPQDGACDFAAMVDDWSALSVDLNSLNRSLGQEDPYPFVLSGPALDKLQLVHSIIVASALR